MTAPFFFAGVKVYTRTHAVPGVIEKSKVLPSGRVMMLIRLPSGDRIIRDSTQTRAVPS